MLNNGYTFTFDICKHLNQIIQSLNSLNGSIQNLLQSNPASSENNGQICKIAYNKSIPLISYIHHIRHY